MMNETSCSRPRNDLLKICILPFAFLALGAVVAEARTFAEACPDMVTCVKSTSEVTGQKYLFDAELKGSAQATANLEFTAENADLLLTKALDLNNLARVPLANPKTYVIVRQRDARDSALPIFRGDREHAPALPDTWDLVTFEYHTAHSEVTDNMARNLRSFMPANSRIIPYEQGHVVFVTDTAANMRKVYDLLRAIDVEVTPEMRKRQAERE